MIAGVTRAAAPGFSCSGRRTALELLRSIASASALPAQSDLLYFSPIVPLNRPLKPGSPIHSIASDCGSLRASFYKLSSQLNN